MRFKKGLAAAIGLAMAATPVLAQSAAPLSIARTGPAMQAASNLDDDGYLLPAIVILAVLTAAILLRGNDEPNNPSSP